MSSAPVAHKAQSFDDERGLNDSKTPKLQAAKAKEFKDKGQKTEDKGWWLLNARRLPAQSFVFCLLSFVLLSISIIQFQSPIGHWPLELDTGNNGNISIF